MPGEALTPAEVEGANYFQVSFWRGLYRILQALFADLSPSLHFELRWVLSKPIQLLLSLISYLFISLLQIDPEWLVCTFICT